MSGTKARRRNNCLQTSVRVFTPIAAILMVFVLVVTVSPTVAATPVGLSTSTHSSTSEEPGVLSSCAIPAAWSDTFDPADGYVYVVSADGGVFVVKPPCDVIRTMLLDSLSYGVVYDPETKEIVVDGFSLVGPDSNAYVIQGLSLVKTVQIGPPNTPCTDGEGWDPAINSVLIADYCPSGFPGGVTALHLTLDKGATHAEVQYNRFDQNDPPWAVLVASGYIFAAGNVVDVFDAKTLHYVGDFAFKHSGCLSGGSSSLAWDPLAQAVILGLGDVCGHGSVVFLSVPSIRSGEFTVSYLSIPTGMLWGGVGGEAFSPYTHDVYLTAYDGNDVWKLSPSGELSHVSLSKDSSPEGPASPQGIAYDPVSHDMYVCGFDSGTVYVIR